MTEQTTMADTKLATGSIDHVYAAIENDANETAVRSIAGVQRGPDATDEEWQYVVSAIAAVLNDETDAAEELRTAAVLEVALFTGGDR
jgi:hypothetical protein